jgi:hypothetical protein
MYVRATDAMGELVKDEQPALAAAFAFSNR